MSFICTSKKIHPVQKKNCMHVSCLLLSNEHRAQWVKVLNGVVFTLLRSYNCRIFKIHQNSVKVEHILKGSLDSIPSPSSLMKIQIMNGKVWLRCKGKTLLGIANNFLYSKFWWQNPVMFCLYIFPAPNLNFHQRWRWWDWIQANFLNLLIFTLTMFSYLIKVWQLLNNCLMLAPRLLPDFFLLADSNYNQK